MKRVEGISEVHREGTQRGIAIILWSVSVSALVVCRKEFVVSSVVYLRYVVSVSLVL